MPPRKRTSAVANGVVDNPVDEPIAKRRSSRQAAAATASKSAAEAPAAPVKSGNFKAVKKNASKASQEPAEKAHSGKTSGKEVSPAVEEAAKPEPAKAPRKAAKAASVSKASSDKKKDKKSKVTKGGEDDAGTETVRSGSEDPDFDSIAAVNPEAPRHDGEWYWLLKAEPETRMENGHDVRFSIDDLRGKTKPEGWDGIRAYPARNNMRNMNVGDKAFFYHSNCKEPGIVGIMEIVKEFSEDKSARRPGTPYYDASSTKEKPKWSLVHVEFRKKFAVPIYLKELRKMGESGGPLQDMQMLKLGRLSVSKVGAEEWKTLCELADEKAKEAGLEHEE